MAGHAKQQAGLAALVLFKHLLLPLPGHAPAAPTIQLCNDDDFWQLLQHSLVMLPALRLTISMQAHFCAGSHSI